MDEKQKNEECCCQGGKRKFCVLGLVGSLLLIFVAAYLASGGISAFSNLRGTWESSDVVLIGNGIVNLLAAITLGFFGIKSVKEVFHGGHIKGNLIYSIMSLLAFTVIGSIISIAALGDDLFSTAASSASAFFIIVLILVDIAALVFMILSLSKPCDIPLNIGTSLYIGVLLIQTFSELNLMDLGNFFGIAGMIAMGVIVLIITFKHPKACAISKNKDTEEEKEIAEDSKESE